MKTRAAVAVFALAVGGLAACGGDDDDDADGPSKEAFCEVNAQVAEAFDEAFSGLDDTSDPEEVGEAIVEATSQMVDDGLMDEARETAPAEVADDVEVLATAVEEAADGDPGSILNGETDEEGRRVDEYCGVANDDEE